MTGAKKVVNTKNQSFHAPQPCEGVFEILSLLFWHLFARPLIQLSSTIFKANFLKMVSINSEFLVVSMVNTAPSYPIA